MFNSYYELFVQTPTADIVVLLLRWAVALAMLPWGIQKIYNWNTERLKFPTVFGMPATLAYTVALLVETCVPFFLMAGFLVRLIAIPTIIQFAVAYKVSVQKCWASPASLYLFAMIVLLIAGSGAYSADALIFAHP
jgi:putative oxidoreductase